MLHLNPVPSRLRGLLALILHGFAVVALLHSGAPFWLKWALAALMPWSLWREAMIFLGRRELARLRLGPGAVELQIDGEPIMAEPPRVLHCSELMIILEFPVRGAESGRRRFSLVLFPDSLETVELRGLRRWLNYERG